MTKLEGTGEGTDEDSSQLVFIYGVNKIVSIPFHRREGFWLLKIVVSENKVIGRLEQCLIPVKQAVHLFELDCDAPCQERLRS